MNNILTIHIEYPPEKWKNIRGMVNIFLKATETIRTKIELGGTDISFNEEENDK